MCQPAAFQGQPCVSDRRGDGQGFSLHNSLTLRTAAAAQQSEFMHGSFGQLALWLSVSRALIILP